MLITDQKTEIKSVRTALTIGKFDGLHIGHMKIVETMLSAAAGSTGEGEPLSKLVVSFVNHPDELLKGDFKGFLLSETEKTDILMNKGIDYYCPLVFDDEMRNTEASDFFKKYIIDTWHCACLVVGDDFCFGKNRAGNLDFLGKACNENNIRLIIVPREEYLGEPVSSSRIRKALEAGEIAEADIMLGRRYCVKGIVERGNRLGHSIGFPTVNIPIPQGKFKPRFGVYGAEARLKGKKYKALANVGVKPTVGEGYRALCEANILDFDEDAYDCYAEISLESFLRPEKRFDSLDELKKQIEKDKKSFTNV